MRKYEYREYLHNDNCTRTSIFAYDTVFIAHIVMGGSGFNTTKLEKGQLWHEGADEIIGVYDIQEDARAAIKEYMNEILRG